MDDNKIVVGITHGDVNGIGYEVIIKTLQDPRILEVCTPVVYGSPKVLAYHRKALNIPNFSLNSISEAKEASMKRANMVNCVDDNIRVELGKSATLAGEAAIIAIDRGIQDLIEHQIDVLVTAPVNKHNIQTNGFHFTGHTEYLQKKLEAPEVLMLMVSDSLRVGVVTGHIPVSDISAALTQDLILRKLRLMYQSLQDDFNINGPRIAVLGLNPHASDEGLIGNDEKEIIIPAIQQAEEEGIVTVGPLSADGFFGSGMFRKFDGILAMYHDQGLAPFKALSHGGGVNYSAGLPLVRTSPAHGTAYELAGKNMANPDSLRDSIFLACDIYTNRKQNRELKKNAMVSAPKDKK